MLTLTSGLPTAKLPQAVLKAPNVDKKIQTCLKDLNSVSHAGNYKEWLSKNKVFLSDLKSNNPLVYKDFMEKFTSAKNNLQQRGVI